MILSGVCVASETSFTSGFNNQLVEVCFSPLHLRCLLGPHKYDLEGGFYPHSGSV